MQSDKVYRMLGLATRAGKVVCGEGAVSDSIRSGKAKLVIVAGDASGNTEKKFKNSCEYYSVDSITADDRFVLGNAVGRSFAVILAVCDESFAKVIKESAQKQ